MIPSGPHVSKAPVKDVPSTTSPPGTPSVLPPEIDYCVKKITSLFQSKSLKEHMTFGKNMSSLCVHNLYNQF